MTRLDDFMLDALSRYYNNRDPLGVDGDFITAPEISQLFGEMIGIWAVQQWIRMGSPTRFNLIEIGPGRGTLMADLLRGTHHINHFHNAMHVHMVETSAVLRTKQQETLNGGPQPHGNHTSIQWHDHLSSVPADIPAIIIANEFFDALPVRQFRYQPAQWAEHFINNDGQSHWQSMTNPPLKHTLPAPKDGDIYEYSQTQEDYAKLIATYHGAALIIDYGYEKSAYGNSLQALYKHAPCAITDHIGDADLTTHIDFEWLASFFQTPKIKTQSQFLQDNGIALRYHKLNNPTLHSGYSRLIHPNQMGVLFKVLDIVL